MKMTIFITGFQSASGVGKTSGKPYEFGKIFNLTPVRNWESEKGKSNSKGFTVDEEKCVNCKISVLARLGQLNFPCFIEADIEPDPEDMSSTIIVDATFVSSVDIFNSPKKVA
jgi:hypothetical protein